MHKARGAIGTRYRMLELLGSGGMGTVHRALDRLEMQHVALKRVQAPTFRFRAVRAGGDPDAASQEATVAVDANTQAHHLGQTTDISPMAVQLDPTTATSVIAFRFALTSEFRTLASLRHPNIISVLDYGIVEDGAPFFTMELLRRAAPLSAAAFGKQRIDVRVALLAQVAQALAYLHRHGVIHRDLKPGNALVVPTRKGLLAKVLDFGLASPLHRSSEGASSLAGTPAYLAPECLVGLPPSEASDLYALGVIAYELLANRPAFSGETVADIVSAVLRHTPDLGAMDAPAALRDIVGRLLQKSPFDRPSDAAELARELEEAGGLPARAESAPVRESFLGAARLTGREAELADLTAALELALADDPRGSGLLLAGESGIGKSRLLDELRIHALVRGALVARGQAVAEGGAAYQVLRNALRTLCVYATPDDLEASVLKSLVPDLPALLEREIADAPELDAKANQERLIDVTLGVLGRLDRPAVLILEDLHWAGPETFPLLTRVLELAERRPLLVVGSYRDEEAPELAAALPRAGVIRLARLDRSRIAALAESMLGPAGRKPDLVALLERETEGNVFFVIEIVRALAEDLGRIDDVGRRALPAQVFSGGVRAALARRLGRVPAWARPLLDVAAVAGRQLDLDALRAVAEGVDLDAWLAACAGAGAIEVADERWRFAHDKLREHLLAALDPDARRALHGTVAAAIERAHLGLDGAAAPHARAGGRQPRGDLAATLAYHHAEAGARREAARYAAQAGEAALREGAFERARDHLEQALTWHEALGSSPRERASLYRLKAAAWIGLGRLAECHAPLERAWTLYGLPIPPHGLPLRGAILREAARQVKRLAGAQGTRLRTVGREVVPEIFDLITTTSQSFSFLGRAEEMLYLYLLGLNLAEAHGHGPRVASYSAWIAYMLSLVPQPALSAMFRRKAARAVRGVDNPRVLASVARAEATLDLGAGAWEAALRAIDRGVALYEQIGDTQLIMLLRLQRASVHCMRGDLEGTQREAGSLLAIATRYRGVQYRAWSLLLLAQVALHRDGPAAAQPGLDTAVREAQASRDAACEVCTLSVRGLAHAYAGQLDAARAHLEETLPQFTRVGVKSYGVLLAAASNAETAAALVRYGAPSGRDFLRRAVESLRSYARLFPIGRAQADLWAGWEAWTTGDEDRAARLLRRGIDAAERAEMLLDLAALYDALAHVTPATDPERAWLRAQAARRFERLGARFHPGVIVWGPP